MLRCLDHKRGRAVSTTNLIDHIKGCTDEAHQAAATAITQGSKNWVTIDDQEVQKYTFSENWEHLVDMLWLRAAGLSEALSTKDEFRDYVSGYDPRAVFPDSRTLHRVAASVKALQSDERLQRIRALKLQFKGKPCVGLQLDMWTDSNTHTAYAVRAAPALSLAPHPMSELLLGALQCITMTSVVDPSDGTPTEKGPPRQLYLKSEILDFGIFPNTQKTGENIKAWFLDRLAANELEHSMVAGITPDGAADGQCGLRLIDSVAALVDTCYLHSLQRGVLFSLGLAGSMSKNEEAKDLLRKDGRVVMLSRQSLAVNKGIKDAQTKAGVPDHKVHTLVPTATTRWGNQFLQIERNNLLRVAIDPVVERFKRDNKGNKEAIVEPNESDQGSKAGTAVPATELGLGSDDWEANQELEGFLRYPYQIKETIEHKGYCTGGQALMLLYDVKDNFCHPAAKLETLVLPATLKMVDRERTDEIKKPEDVSAMIDTARRILKTQLQERCFDLRASNSRMVQLYMSKQMDVKGMLTDVQYELARTLYLQWLRAANDLKKLPTREGSPRKKQKTSGPSLFRGAGLVEGAQNSPAARTQSDGFDPVTDEIERWERLSPDSYSAFFDEGGLLNEFAMMWALRERFPLHFIVFKQTACHLPHEANVEQIFSRAGNLSDPNIDPEYLANLVSVLINKKSFKPSLKAIKEKYYELFRGLGDEQQQQHGAREGEAGSSN